MKRRIVKVMNGVRKKFQPSTKFRIGTRKAGTSAQEMSNSKLLKILSNPSEKRYHTKAITVLGNRGINFLSFPEFIKS